VYTILAYNYSSFDVAGPDPFLDQDRRNASASNRTQIALKSDAVAAQVQIRDDDPQFHDPRFEHRGPQTLASDLSLAGSDFKAGQSVPRPRVVHLHLLLEGHHVVSAEGAGVESLWPGPEALRSLGETDRAALSRATGPVDPDGPAWRPARPLLRPGAWQRAQGRTRLSA
jgi:hypothetical protein